ncbi:MAG: hypothetical protein H6799_02355 [Candidatus Nomurabacteria bacterium]|nr:MAG: hypothetical protein H6799_02355 [Candidatus Nomurabacteria bacterium]
MKEWFIGERKIKELPINVSNEDIGKYFCYVGRMESGQEAELNPDDRVELRLRD